MPQPFEKPALSIPQQIELLESRGLIISDRALAAHYLTFISYYRFCGYSIGFETSTDANSEKRYEQGTTFEQILDYYIFDRKLRLLVMDAIERIEIAIRTVITNELSLKYGAHWYLNQSLFLKKFKQDDLIQTIKKETQYATYNNSKMQKKREHFIQHYYTKYSDPELPAVWMVAEILSLGTWSMIFAHLANREDQKIICKPFDLSYRAMTSWLHSLTYLRNLCAHHSMLWNRYFTFKPLIATQYEAQLMNNARFSAQAAILKVFLDAIAPENNWGDRLYQLLQEHPGINIQKMGFKINWFRDPFWSTGN